MRFVRNVVTAPFCAGASALRPYNNVYSWMCQRMLMRLPSVSFSIWTCTGNEFAQFVNVRDHEDQVEIFLNRGDRLDQLVTPRLILRAEALVNEQASVTAPRRAAPTTATARFAARS